MRISFAGPFGSGKSSVADYMEERYDMEKWSLGDYVRSALIDMGFDPGEIFSEPKSPEVRELLQGLGHGARGMNKNFWVDKLIADMELFQPDGMCVDDMRYSNEAEAFRDEGFKLVYVECPGLYGDEARNHPSEHGLDDWFEWDGVLTADYGNIKDLFTQMDELVEAWEKE